METHCCVPVRRTDLWFRHCVSCESCRTTASDRWNRQQLVAMTPPKPVVYYTADMDGLWPGAMTTSTISPYDSQRYTWATSNLDLARAFAFGGLSIYRVQLDQPIMHDPDFRQA